MHIFNSFDDVGIAYWDQGDGDPIMLLHGFTADSHINWEKSGIAQELVKSGRRVIMMDARGHGESDKPHTSYSYWNRAMAKDVGELAQYLMLYDYDVLGYSMGAKVAIEAELMYGRMRSLVLAGLHIYDKDWTLSDKEREKKVRSMLDDNPTEKDPYREFAEKTGGDRKAFAARLEGNIYPEFSHWDLKKIHLSVLVINGTREYDAELAASFFPNAKGISLRGSHITLLRNKSFSNEVINFLDGLDKK
ncbi:MAG: alpha/beta hydrolase [Thermodesulfobacteriota bacterium]